MANTVAVTSFFNTVTTASPSNSIALSPSANAVTVEAADIYTHYLFLSPAHVLEEHEEV